MRIIIPDTEVIAPPSRQIARMESWLALRHDTIDSRTTLIVETA